jgi:hypothetical protein
MNNPHPKARGLLKLPTTPFRDNFLIADQPDAIEGSSWLLRHDHQSPAWLVAVPSVLNICQRDTFRVYMKFPFCGTRHHLLKSFEQNVARWNPSGAQNCQRRTT